MSLCHHHLMTYCHRSIVTWHYLQCHTLVGLPVSKDISMSEFNEGHKTVSVTFTAAHWCRLEASPNNIDSSLRIRCIACWQWHEVTVTRADSDTVVIRWLVLYPCKLWNHVTRFATTVFDHSVARETARHQKLHPVPWHGVFYNT